MKKRKKGIEVLDTINVKIYNISKIIFNFGFIISSIFVMYGTLKHFRAVDNALYWSTFISMIILFIGLFGFLLSGHTPDKKIITIEKKVINKSEKTKNKNMGMVFE